VTGHSIKIQTATDLRITIGHYFKAKMSSLSIVLGVEFDISLNIFIIKSIRQII